jgi:hypothetical protein
MFVSAVVCVSHCLCQPLFVSPQTTLHKLLKINVFINL